MFEEIKNVLEDRKKVKEAYSNKDVSRIEQFLAINIIDKMQYGVRYIIISSSNIDKDSSEVIEEIRSEKKNGKLKEVNILKIKDGFIIEISEEYCLTLFKKIIDKDLSSEEKSIFFKEFESRRKNEKEAFKEYLKENIRNSKNKIKFAIYNTEKEYNIIDIKRGKRRGDSEAFAIRAFAVTMEEVAQTCNEINKLGFRIDNIFVNGILDGDRALLVRAEIK